MHRAWRVVFSPASEWQAVAAERRDWRALLFGYVLPLALLPAAGWAVGVALGSDAAGFAARQFFAAFATTLVLSPLSIALLALALYVISPMYGLRRDWNGAVAVAAYGSTPVLVAGALLVIPVLVAVCVVALLHGFFLCYLGVQRVLGCRRSESAEFVAVSCLLAGLASLAAGAAGGALGLL